MSGVDEQERQVFCKNESDNDVDLWLGSNRELYRGLNGNPPDHLDNLISRNGDASADVAIFLRQDYSWGHLFLTEETFARISRVYGAFSALREHVMSFAFKTSDRDEHFSVSDSNIHQPSDTGEDNPSYHELCYLLRYPARHGRKGRFPFSLRQMAIYQRFEKSRNTSKWLFIQLPTQVVDKLQSSFSSGTPRLVPSSVHEAIFSAAEQHWRDYICHLDDELRGLEEKVSYIDIEVSNTLDYSIASTDSQKLQRLRRKIVKTKEILDCCLQVAINCKDHWCRLREHGMSDPDQTPPNLEWFIARMKMSKTNVEAVQEHLDGVFILLSQILNLRTLDSLAKSSEALDRTSTVIRDIAVAAKAESELMMTLVSKSQRDSYVIKIMTVVAMIYLPASLVATIFNSNLVQVRQDTGNANEDHLVLLKSFWLYPVLTVSLMALTILPLAYMYARTQPRWCGVKFGK